MLGPENFLTPLPPPSASPLRRKYSWERNLFCFNLQTFWKLAPKIKTVPPPLAQSHSFSDVRNRNIFVFLYYQAQMQYKGLIPRALFLGEMRNISPVSFELRLLE
jgi:hypothetical protein